MGGLGALMERGGSHVGCAPKVALDLQMQASVDVSSV